jgi:hypothetical protein
MSSIACIGGYDIIYGFVDDIRTPFCCSESMPNLLYNSARLTCCSETIPRPGDKDVRDCSCINPEGCSEPDNPLTKVTSNGIY